MPERHRPFRASYIISGVEAERSFASLLDVRRFPEWVDPARPFFRRVTEDLIKRSMRRFDAHLRSG